MSFVRPTPRSQPTGAPVRALIVLALVGTAAGSIALLDTVVRVAAIGDSDGATVVLEGQSINAGHILLSGWSLSLDSFWSIDALFYTVAVHFAGLRGNLVFLVPAVIAALVILVVATMAMDRRISVAAGAGALVATAVLALPSRAFAVYFVEGPYHIGTALWCLLAFALLAQNRFDSRWVLAVAFLAAGLLGDFQTVLLGEAPVLATALVATWCQRRWKGALPLLSAPVAAALLAFAIRQIALAFGTFTIAPANPFASAHQLLRNVQHLPVFFGAMLGIYGGAFGPTGLPIEFRILDVLRLLVVVGGPLVVLALIGKRVWKARSGPNVPTRSELLTCMVCIAFVCDVGTFVLFPITNSPAYARYLNGALIFGALVGGRLVTAVLSGRSARLARSIAATVVGVVALFAVGFAFEIRGPRPVQPATQLASYLEANHLTNGVGAYWSAAITTLESRGSLGIRPVIEHGSRLVRYEKNSDAAWYAGVAFHYVVYNAEAPWGGVSKKSAVADVGLSDVDPCHRSLPRARLRASILGRGDRMDRIDLEVFGFSNCALDPQPALVPRLLLMMAKRLTTRRIERQLRSVVLELAAARERVVVAKQQYEAFRDDDEEAQTRSLGSEMVEDRHVADQARRHAELMRLAVLRAEVAVAALEKSRDELLARYEPAG